MAGVTSSPFRLLCRRYGAGMSFSELVSSNALVMGGAKSQEKSHQLAWFCQEERPVAVQIFGADPDMMREAATIIAATVEGAAVYGVPVTVKMRAGWDEHNIAAPEVARRAEAVGAVGSQGRRHGRGP